MIKIQAVVSSHQLVANGYVNGTAVAVAPTAYVATASPAVVHTSVPHGYHPYQQVRQVTTVKFFLGGERNCYRF